MGKSLDSDSKDFKWNNYINSYHMRHIDLMDVLAKHNARATAPLDALAKLCGFPGKLVMDGSQVRPTYQRGEIEQIRQYCETDVANTYLVYCYFQQMRGGFTTDEYDEELAYLKQQLERDAK